MSERIEITVDGRPVEVAGGGMLLAALRSAGVQVPTLCDHPSLEPSGACRLCVVEVTHPEWNGWQGLVTACLFPVERGLVVFTRSERVRQVRRGLLELYLAECPESEVVRELARSEGVDTTPFQPKAEPDLCVRCGLCIRVCQDLGPAAIAPLGRGADKRVGPRPDGYGEDCTGCRACAHVCPTGEIRAVQEDGRLTLWKRTFEIPVCSVDETACRGCGVCEEVCPLSIPRVTVDRAGSVTARIAPTNCVGCGICAGACPTGAIHQRDGDPAIAAPIRGEVDILDDTVRDRLAVFACSRSPLAAPQAARPDATSRGHGAAAPAADGFVHIPVSCVGRVPVDTMLDCLAQGAGAVLLVCRDQASCPYGSGGALGERHVAVAEELAAAAGLGSGRVRFVTPGAGLAAPAEAVAAHRRTTAPTPLRVLRTGGGRATGGAAV
ncbi:MAG: 2Fe-2S iron-sulfur cluster-binding protein, partial [Candidatus Eiseniibacteriota bacterium]